MTALAGIRNTICIIYDSDGIGIQQAGTARSSNVIYLLIRSIESCMKRCATMVRVRRGGGGINYLFDALSSYYFTAYIPFSVCAKFKLFPVVI